MDDGQDRGARVALGAVLLKLGLLDKSMFRELEEYLSPDLTNSRGDTIGRAEMSSAWDDIHIKDQISLSF